MKRILTFVLAVATLYLASAANAFPTLTGPTGQAVIPTAEVADSGFTVAGDWARHNPGHSDPLRALIPLGMGVEIGAMYDKFSSETALDNAWGVNAKVKLGSFVGGDAAVGGQFIRQKDVADFKTDYTQGYAAWTTNLLGGAKGVSNLSLTIGGNWTHVAPQGATKEDAVRGYAGASLNLLRDISLLAEYQTKSDKVGDTKPITAYTVRLGRPSGLSVEAGSTNAFELVGTDKQEFFAGLSLAFSLGGGRY